MEHFGHDFSHQVELSDGNRMVVRECQIGDCDDIVQFILQETDAAVSPNYFMFAPGTSMPGPAATTSPTLLALLDEGRGARVVGVAKLFMSTTEPAVADVVVVVSSLYQGREVGCALLESVIRRAREFGAEQLSAEVHGEGGQLIELLEEAGFSFTLQPGEMFQQIQINFN